MPLELEFMRLAYAAGLLIGVLAPIVGFFLVERRLALLGDGLGHFAFAGLGLAVLIGTPPVATALGVTVGGAVGIEWLRSRGIAGDQALALFFYVGLALGAMLFSLGDGLGSIGVVLFGAILTVSRDDVLLIAALAAGSLVTVALFYRALLASAIDEDAARVQGLPVTLLNIGTVTLAAVTVAISMKVVGVLLIAALMVLPVLTARLVAWSAASTIVLSAAFGVTASVVGLTVSYYANVAPGAAIVLVAAASFALAGSLRWLVTDVRRRSSKRKVLA